MRISGLRTNRGFNAAVVAVTVAACSPAPRWVVVTGDSTLTLLAPDLAEIDTRALGLQAGSGQTVTDARVASDGLSIYVALRSHTGGSVVRTRRTDARALATREISRGAPTALVLSPGTQAVLVAVAGHAEPAGELHLLAANRLRTITQLPVCAGAVRGIAVFDAREKAYVLCAEEAVTEVDLELGLRVRTASLPVPTGTEPGAGCDPRGIALSVNGTILLVACGGSGQLLYLDRVSFALLGSLHVGTEVRHLAILPTGKRALTIHERRNELVLVDLLRRRIATRVALPSPPRDVAVSGDGRWAYVLLEGRAQPSAVLKVDLDDGDIVARAYVPHGSRTVAVWPTEHSPVMRW